jgi:hypothetical protein
MRHANEAFNVPQSRVDGRPVEFEANGIVPCARDLSAKEEPACDGKVREGRRGCVGCKLLNFGSKIELPIPGNVREDVRDTLEHVAQRRRRVNGSKRRQSIIVVVLPLILMHLSVCIWACLHEERVRAATAPSLCVLDTVEATNAWDRGNACEVGLEDLGLSGPNAEVVAGSVKLGNGDECASELRYVEDVLDVDSGCCRPVWEVEGHCAAAKRAARCVVCDPDEDWVNCAEMGEEVAVRRDVDTCAQIKDAELPLVLGQEGGAGQGGRRGQGLTSWRG